MTRADVIKELEVPCDCFSYDNERCYHPDFTIDRMADEILRLRAILDALREPGEKVSDAAFESFYGVDMPKSLPWAIRAAVAAAEQEVANDAG